MAYFDLAERNTVKKEPMYMCVGENYREDTRLGYCGTAHTITNWVETLFTNQGDAAKDFFAGWSNKEISEYILKNKGKRLKPIT